jgi:co-chaperonin GroES (HSP10)
MMPALKAIHKVNPKTEILKRVGDLSDFKVAYNQVLCAVYVPPEDAQFGTLKIIQTDKTRDEARYQGKVGLVLQMGPRAFVDDADRQFYGFSIKVGDWIVFRASDGWQLTLTDNQVLCRMFTEWDIRGVVQSPDFVW